MSFPRITAKEISREAERARRSRGRGNRISAPDPIKPITDSPAAEQKAESVETAQDAARVMAQPGPVATIRGFGSLLGGTIVAFFSDDCPSHAAALAFYAFFSLPALLTLLLTLLGRLTDPARLQQGIVRQVGGLIGNSGADQVTTIIGNAHLAAGSQILATTLSIAALAFGATTSFAQLQTALNKVWGVKPDPRRNQLHVFLMKRIFSFGVVITVAFLLLVSLALNTMLTAVGDRISSGVVPTLAFQAATSLIGRTSIAGAIMRTTRGMAFRWSSLPLVATQTITRSPTSHSTSNTTTWRA